MAADVVQYANFAIGAAHCEHRQAGEVGDHMIADLLQLADVRDQLPAAIEDRATVECGHAGIGIEVRRRRTRAVERLWQQGVGRTGIATVHLLSMDPAAEQGIT